MAYLYGSVPEPFEIVVMSQVLGLEIELINRICVMISHGEKSGLRDCSLSES